MDHWTSPEDIAAWRNRAVRKNVEMWVDCPWSRPTDKGQGSGGVMLDTVEVLDDPDNPIWE